MAADMAVAASAYQTAKSLGASDKVMLALFETGVVESGFRNLSGGDRDSVGFLQQRPSQGWGSVAECMNVPHATTSFVKRAMANEGRYLTSGQLAQSVQISAFPLRYDAARSQAQKILADVQGGKGGASAGGAVVATPVSGLGDQVGAIVNFAKVLSDPNTWKRLAMFLAGAALVIVALFKLTGDNKLSSTTKSLVASAIVKKPVLIK